MLIKLGVTGHILIKEAIIHKSPLFKPRWPRRAPVVANRKWSLTSQTQLSKKCQWLNLGLHNTCVPCSVQLVYRICRREFCFFSIFIFGHRPNINIFIKLFVVWGSTVFGKNRSILVILLWGSHLGDLKRVQTCLKLNKSKTTYPIWTNLTSLNNIDQITSE